MGWLYLVVFIYFNLSLLDAVTLLWEIVSAVNCSWQVLTTQLYSSFSDSSRYWITRFHGKKATHVGGSLEIFMGGDDRKGQFWRYFA